MFGIELRQFLLQKQIDILSDGPFRATIDSDPLSLQFHQGAHSDSSDRNDVNLAPSQGFQGLAHAVSVMQIIVADFFNGPGIRICDHKTGSRPKMSVNAAFHSFEIGCGKTNPHNFSF